MLMTKQKVIDKWRKDKRRKVSVENKRRFCPGCRQNWYNVNMKGCWHLAKSKVKEREIYASLSSVKPDKVVTLDCYMQSYR